MFFLVLIVFLRFAVNEHRLKYLKYSLRTLKSLMIMPNQFKISAVLMILVDDDFGESDFRRAYGATESEYILV